jgi:hypothetical protein
MSSDEAVSIAIAKSKDKFNESVFNNPNIGLITANDLQINDEIEKIIKE